MSDLYLLTAPIGAGKTTFSRHIADQARASGWNVAGLLSPPIFTNGIKTGILAQSLRTGDAHTLAIAASKSGFRPVPFNFPFGIWLFDPSVIEWGNQVLETSLPCDLFIVDELGPLELVRSQGWVAALDALRQPEYRIGLAVIRPELLETARKILPVTHFVRIESSMDIARQAQEWWHRVENDVQV